MLSIVRIEVVENRAGGEGLVDAIITFDGFTGITSRGCPLCLFEQLRIEWREPLTALLIEKYDKWTKHASPLPESSTLLLCLAKGDPSRVGKRRLERRGEFRRTSESGS